MNEVKDHPQTEQDAGRHVEPIVGEELAPHVQIVPNPEQEVITKLNKLGVKSEGEAALANTQVDNESRIKFADETNSTEPIKKTPVENTSRWNRIFRIFQQQKKGSTP